MKSLNGYLHVEVRPEFLPPVLFLPPPTATFELADGSPAFISPAAPRAANQVVHADVLSDPLPASAFVAGSEVVFDLANAMALPKAGKLKEGEHEFTYFIHMDSLLAADGIDKPPEDTA